MMIDFSLIPQNESNTLLGITITLDSSSSPDSDSASDYSYWCMYLSISRADGPVGTSRFLNTCISSLFKYFIRPSRKSSISALLVGKPFFFFVVSALRTRGLDASVKFLKAWVIESEQAISFKRSMTRLFMIIVEIVSSFSFYPSLTASSESLWSTSSTTWTFIWGDYSPSSIRISSWTDLWWSWPAGLDLCRPTLSVSSSSSPYINFYFLLFFVLIGSYSGSSSTPSLKLLSSASFYLSFCSE